MPKKVLIINTSASQFTGGPTGVWLEETATPYYALKDAGFEVEMANPAGGPSPIDQGSMGGDFFTESGKKFLHDPAALGMFLHQKKLADVEPSITEYDAIYLAGGHGCCTDFVDNAPLKACMRRCTRRARWSPLIATGPSHCRSATSPTASRSSRA